eukprot:CAMPEP_0167790890 /NCGR_PEP_ID=MMETSP0111_2-20121227/11594_1 /TAXON_ID=91324 /ORGANISM="Lotharella globosa, Strain CCCM811" /LENGTH=75 /DNA_ID=CAMNT_0007683423 /DNA_START=648 /DNA_END=876 /DNA_ORIENTATION=-
MYKYRSHRHYAVAAADADAKADHHVIAQSVVVPSQFPFDERFCDGHWAKHATLNAGSSEGSNGAWRKSNWHEKSS